MAFSFVDMALRDIPPVFPIAQRWCLHLKWSRILKLAAHRKFAFLAFISKNMGQIIVPSQIDVMSTLPTWIPSIIFSLRNSGPAFTMKFCLAIWRLEFKTDKLAFFELESPTKHGQL
jgi:hypothetical protein